MSKKGIIAALVLLLMTFGFGPRLMASCESDCQEGYNSETLSCEEQFNDPDDADQLKDCMDSAKNEYDSCLVECQDQDSQE